MNRENLTDRRIKGLKAAPKGKRYDVMDAVVPGLGVRVTDKGNCSFFLSTRFGVSKNPTRRTIGKYGRVSLAEARDKAREWIVLVQEGKDPKIVADELYEAERRKRDLTFGAVVEDYIRMAVIGRDHEKPLQRKGHTVARELREEFVHGRVRNRQVRKPWKDRPLQSITSADVLRVIDDAVERGAKYQAHNLLGHVRTLFNWAIARGDYGIDRSPTDRMRPKQVIGKKALRTRILSDHEIRTLWFASDKLNYPYGPLFQLLITTGQRKNEVANARWEEFDLDQKLWLIPASRMKADSPHGVPLSNLAIQIITSLPRFKDGSYLFSTTFGEKAVNGFSKSKLRLDAAMQALEPSLNIDDENSFVIHDMRRTVRTRMSGLPISSEVAELVIAHSRPGLRRVYDQFSYMDKKREALDLWASSLTKIFESSSEL